MLRRTLDELKSPNLKVNFDPANMLLYDMGDPIRAVEILGPDIRSVHVKDASRPTASGQWGEEVPLGEGEVDIRRFRRGLEEERLHRPAHHRARSRRPGRTGCATWPRAWNSCGSAWEADLAQTMPTQDGSPVSGPPGMPA